jgi:hypothetical protein
LDVLLSNQIKEADETNCARQSDIVFFFDVVVRFCFVSPLPWWEGWAIHALASHSCCKYVQQPWLSDQVGHQLYLYMLNRVLWGQLRHWALRGEDSGDHVQQPRW